MNIAYDNLIAHFDEHDWNYDADSVRHLVRAGLRGRACSFDFVAVVDEEDDVFQVIAFVPVAIPEGCRAVIAETVARINYSLKIGKFEFEYDEGRLRYQVGQILVDSRLDDRIIHAAIGCCVSMVDRYLPAILSVIYGNELPKDAVCCAEADLVT